MKNNPIPGPRAQEILERDRKVISQSYPRAAQFVMDRGAGSEVWDVDGNRYLDFAAGIAVCSTGHSHPQVVRAIQKQAEKFIHISSDFYHPVWVEFSERLAATKPFQDSAKIFLGNSGTEAIEAAIKLARYHTGRQQFIGFYGSFHGRTMGALSFTATKPVYRKRFFPLMDGVVHVPYPDPYRPRLAPSPAGLTEATIRYIEEVIFENVLPTDNCAGILLEPIQGEGGYIVPPDDFFPALRKLCDQYGILLIVDEVQSGVGRTGQWWAVQNWQTEPDIVCFAKGIASGIPLGGIMAPETIMSWPKGAHGNTYGGNPIACSAGLATLELIEAGLLQNAAEVGQYAIDALFEIQARHPSIGDVRGKGLMIGVEFVTDKQSKYPDHDLREQIIELAFQGGLLLLGSGPSSIRIAPPLTILRDQIDEGLNVLETAITSAEKDR